MLTGPLPTWDFERRRVDVAPFARWIVESARALGVSLAVSNDDSLDDPLGEVLARVHEHVDAAGALALSRHLTLHSRAAAPRALVHAMLRAALPELPWGDVVVQSAAHVRVLVPGDTVSPAPMHSDRAIGHGLDERNVWIALTDARATAALHALSLRASLEAERRRIARGAIEHGDVRAPPIEVASGDVLLFTPVHVHGARVVREPVTRVSVDVRIAPAALPRGGAGFSFVAVAP